VITHKTWIRFAYFRIRQ